MRILFLPAFVPAISSTFPVRGLRRDLSVELDLLDLRFLPIIYKDDPGSMVSSNTGLASISSTYQVFVFVRYFGREVGSVTNELSNISILLPGIAANAPQSSRTKLKCLCWSGVDEYKSPYGAAEKR